MEHAIASAVQFVAQHLLAIFLDPPLPGWPL